MLHEAGRHRLLRYRADQRLQLRRRYLNHFPRQCRVQRLGAPRGAWRTGGLLGRGCATAGAASGFAPAGSLNSTPCLSSPAIRSDFRSHNIRCSFCTFSSSTRTSAESCSFSRRKRVASSEASAIAAMSWFTAATVSNLAFPSRTVARIRYDTTTSTHIIVYHQLK